MSTHRQRDLFKKSIQERFEEFHEGNPHVYEKLREVAFLLKQRGRRKCAIGFLWERLRWIYSVEVDDPNSEFELNDHYRSRYARLLMEREPELRGFFEVRTLRAS